MTDDKLRTYDSESIEVSYSTRRCIHAAECVNRLRDVFDTTRRPWIQPQNAPAAAVATTIEHCPTGALHYTRKDGGPAEAPAEHASLHIVADGPIYVRGAVTVKNPAGETLLEDTRVALCRCGVSHNKPLCDNSHGPAGFAAGDALAQNLHKSDAGLAGAAALTITPQVDGPVLVEGDFSLHSSDGAAVYQGKKVWLCRCGASANKPFCDGTHKRTGFTAP